MSLPSSRRPSGVGRTSRVGSIDPTRLVPMDKLTAVGGSVRYHHGTETSFSDISIGRLQRRLRRCRQHHVRYGQSRTRHPRRSDGITGSDEGPWNHSFRFEHKLGPRLKVIALIDPAIERAHSVLRKKCESFVVSAYQDTRGLVQL
jgi:hypothetical protein